MSELNNIIKAIEHVKFFSKSMKEASLNAWEPFALKYGYSFIRGDVMFIPRSFAVKLCEKLEIEELPYFIKIHPAIEDHIVFIKSYFYDSGCY